MNISFENKITFGFLANILVVLATGILYLWRVRTDALPGELLLVDWIIIALLAVSLLLLFVVYQIILRTVKTRDEFRRSLIESRTLLQSVIDNSTNPIYVKKLNGEFLLVNEKFCRLFDVTPEEAIGKTGIDFMSEENAKVFKESRVKLLSEGTNIEVEEELELKHGKQTYLSVKFPLYDTENRIYAVGSISTEITLRKLDEESMREGERFFKLSNDALMIASEERMLRVNPAMCNALGYEEKDLVDKPWTSILHPDDLKSAHEVIRRLNQGMDEINYESRVMCKDGTLRWFNWTLSSEKVDHFDYYYAVGHDVTDRKALHESLKPYEHFFEMSFDLMVVANAKYFIRANPTFSRLLGYRVSDVGRAPFLDFIHPEEKEKASEEIEKLIKGKPLINFRARARNIDKSYKWLEWSATFDKEAELIYGVARDVSEQVKLEEEEKNMAKELYEREQRLQLILENINDGVLVVNSNGKVILANYSANALYRNEVDENINADLSSIYKLYYPDGHTVFPSQNLPNEKALNGEELEDVDLIISDEENNIHRRVLMSGRPILDQNNKVVAAVVTIKDISRFKQLEEELKETRMKYRREIGFRKEEGGSDNG